MLQLQLLPGKGLGDFIIGMPISEAIAVVQQNIDAVSFVELKFNESNPLGMDIIMDLIEDGFLLKFDPVTQRLKMIEIYDVPKVTLSYCGSVFSSANILPTFVLIYSRFGPSYPGEYNAAKNVYFLHYPNLSFTFPIPSKFQSLYNDGTGELPVEFPDGTTPITTRIYIYSGQKFTSPNLPPLPSSSLYFEPVTASVTAGLTFTRRNASLGFNSSAQDVISELGPPARVYYKEEDKMRIHSASSNGVLYADYFYNYFSLGLDFLIDAHTHTVKKIVLHTNFPTHFEFNQYSKCNFKLLAPEAKRPVSNENNAAVAAEEGMYIEPDSRWDTVQTLFGKASKPVVNNRGSTANPFGATYFHGYHGIIFEVMRNNHIASVCIYSTEKKE